jgi:hypothetical protein
MMSFGGRVGALARACSMTEGFRWALGIGLSGEVGDVNKLGTTAMYVRNTTTPLCAGLSWVGVYHHFWPGTSLPTRAAHPHLGGQGTQPLPSAWCNPSIGVQLCTLPAQLQILLEEQRGN